MISFGHDSANIFSPMCSQIPGLSDFFNHEDPCPDDVYDAYDGLSAFESESASRFKMPQSESNFSFMGTTNAAPQGSAPEYKDTPAVKTAFGKPHTSPRPSMAEADSKAALANELGRCYTLCTLPGKVKDYAAVTPKSRTRNKANTKHQPPVLQKTEDDYIICDERSTQRLNVEMPRTRSATEGPQRQPLKSETSNATYLVCSAETYSAIGQDAWSGKPQQGKSSKKKPRGLRSSVGDNSIGAHLQTQVRGRCMSDITTTQQYEQPGSQNRYFEVHPCMNDEHFYSDDDDELAIPPAPAAAPADIKV